MVLLKCETKPVLV